MDFELGRGKNIHTQKGKKHSLKKSSRIDSLRHDMISAGPYALSGASVRMITAVCNCKSLFGSLCHRRIQKMPTPALLIKSYKLQLTT